MYDVPKFLIDYLEAEYGTLEANKILEGYSNNRFTTFRINIIKSNKEEIEEYLKSNNIEYIIGELPNTYILPNNNAKELYDTKIVEDGLIYFQSLSSMLPPIYLEPNPDEDILDMAAAPGGKTTMIAAMTNNKSRICAVEKDKFRFERLKYNILKQGATSVFVINKDSKTLDDYMKFDKILLDAPCSGSGTINTNNKIKISKELINNSSKLQVELLTKALKILKNDSYMIYSTCSILHFENEDVLNKVLPKFNAEIVPLEFKSSELLKSSIDGVIKVRPSKYYEGFFIAKIHKK